MNEKLIKFNLTQRKNKSIPDFKSGDIIKVYRKIIEGQKERVQVFEGMIIAVNGKQSSSPTITVRKISGGVGVELVLPVFSPSVEKIEITKRAKVKRSKLYYIRDKSAKSLRLKYKDIADFASAEEESSKDASQDGKVVELSKEEKNEETSGKIKEKGDSKDKSEVEKTGGEDAPTDNSSKEEQK